MFGTILKQLGLAVEPNANCDLGIEHREYSAASSCLESQPDWFCRSRCTSSPLTLMVEQVRHKPFSPLVNPRELLVACPAFRSHVNLSRLVRLAGCVAIPKIITCGPGKVDSSIAREAAEHVTIERRRSLAPILKELSQQGHRLIGLEQVERSVSLFDYQFSRRSVLVLGNERLGLEPELLDLMDDLVEIPVYGPPHSYNVVTAATMAIYEYCKQFPQ